MTTINLKATEVAIRISATGEFSFYLPDGELTVTQEKAICVALLLEEREAHGFAAAWKLAGLVQH